MMVGRALSTVFPPKAVGPSGDAALVVQGLSGQGFDSVDITVAPGRIVGLAGVEGNGQRELLRALAGLGPSTSGQVTIGGQPVTIHGPEDARAAGVRFIPADRAREGLLRTLTVAENISAGALSSVSRGGWVSGSRERAAVAREIAATGIRTGSPASGVATLSGGNQQKVVFARSMLSSPKVLLCDEPTRGVDVGARREIYGLLRQLTDDGHPVVVLSADAAELAGLCDSVLIFSRGRVVRTLVGDEVTEANITGTALRATRGQDPSSSSASAISDGRPESQPRAHRPLAERLRARLSRSDSAPGAIVLLAAVILAVVTGISQPSYLQSLNLSLLLYGAAALILIAMGQLLVVLTAGIDLSVGPLVGMLVVAMSFLTDDSKTGGGLALGLLITFLLAGAVGLVNGLLVAVVKMPPIIATLATFISLEGVSLLLRPRPGGSISAVLMTEVQRSFGPLPVVFIVVVPIAIAGERWLTRSRAGFALRSIGSSEVSAARLGVRVRAVQIAAYVGCSLLTCMAAVLMASQIGVGDPTQGVSYTLASISVVVLGGASIYGGRGSFLATLCGGLLLAVIANAGVFLGLDEAWQFWLPGGLMLLATAVSSRARGVTLSALAH
jgi:ribose transport system ATP-binding protein